jgi:hypothetical protein
MPKLTKTNNNIEKKAVVEAYIKCFGNVTETCKLANISRYTFYEWLKNDEKFKYEIDNAGAEEYFLDFLESKLAERINEKSDACLIFAMKCKGKKRGYIERIETDARVESVSTVKISDQDLQRVKEFLKDI